MGDGGFIAGVVLGSAAAFGFVAACLYSAYKAIRDHKRIAEKQAERREQQLLAISEKTGAAPLVSEDESGDNAHQEQPGRTSRSLSTPGLLEQRRPSAFAPPPQAMERRWTRAGLEYRHEGGVVHIHKTDSDNAPDSAEDIDNSSIPYKRYHDSGEPPASPRGKVTPGTKPKKMIALSPPPQVQIQVSLTAHSDSNGDTMSVEEVTVTKPVSVCTSGDGSRTQTVTEISTSEPTGNVTKAKDAADWV